MAPRRLHLQALPDELIEEILLRIPPDDPASLLRASLVCKSWSEAISHRGFRRRLHDLHRAPPALEVFHDWHDEDIPGFIPATASPFSLASPDRLLWRAVDCRHGRALFLSEGPRTEEFLVLEPITGAQQCVPVPMAFQRGNTTAAVFCATDGCNHHDCHEGPFCVVFVFSVDDDEDADYEACITSACVYSSKTGAWGEPTLMHTELSMDFIYYSSVLVGRSQLYFMSCGGVIMEYDLVRHGLTWFEAPHSCYSKDTVSCNLMLAEDGGLGLVEELDPHLQLWSWEATDARWVPKRVIHLESLFLNDGAPAAATCPLHVLGFAEEANVIFFTTAAGLFTIQLQSERVTKVCQDHGYRYGNIGFYTPRPPIEQMRRRVMIDGTRVI